MERRIAEILIQELKLENVTPDTFDASCDLVKELGIDSMDLTTVVRSMLSIPSSLTRSQLASNVSGVMFSSFSSWIKISAIRRSIEPF